MALCCSEDCPALGDDTTNNSMLMVFCRVDSAEQGRIRVAAQLGVAGLQVAGGVAGPLHGLPTGLVRLPGHDEGRGQGGSQTGPQPGPARCRAVGGQDPLPPHPPRQRGDGASHSCGQEARWQSLLVCDQVWEGGGGVDVCHGQHPSLTSTTTTAQAAR